MTAITLPSALRGPVRTVADDFRARRAEVRLPSRRAVGGVASIPEILSTYGIYIFFAAIALVAASVILNQILAARTVRDFVGGVESIQKNFAHSRGGSKAGMNTVAVANGGHFAEHLLDGPVATRRIMLDEDYPVQFFPLAAATNATALGVGHIRYFVVSLAGDAVPLPAGLCTDIVSAVYHGLVAVNITDKGTGLPGTAEAALGAVAGTATAPRSWTVRKHMAGVAGVAVHLDDYSESAAEAACDAAARSTNGAQLALVFR